MRTPLVDAKGWALRQGVRLFEVPDRVDAPEVAELLPDGTVRVRAFHPSSDAKKPDTWLAVINAKGKLLSQKVEKGSAPSKP